MHLSRLLQRFPWHIGALSFLLHLSLARPSRTPGISSCGSWECHLTSWEQEPPLSLLDWGGTWIADYVSRLSYRTEEHEAYESSWKCKTDVLHMLVSEKRPGHLRVDFGRQDYLKKATCSSVLHFYSI